MPAAIGIDFGTSNSTVGICLAAQPKLTSLEAGKVTMPSALFYPADGTEPLFGRAAISAYTDHHEGRLLRALKSILGNALVKENTVVGGKRQSFKAILATYLHYLKHQAELQTGQPIDSAVLGRPVHFVDDDPAADAEAQDQLQQAAASIGFLHIEFQFEPIAAALDYEQNVTGEELALIADIGGGTSDFSVIRVSQHRRLNSDRKNDILANSGVHVGGTDLDRRLSVNQVMPHFGCHTSQRLRPELDLPLGFFYDLATWHKIAFLHNYKTRSAVNDIYNLAARPDLVARLVTIIEKQDGHRLAGDIEVAKIILSQAESATLNLNYVEKDLRIEVKQQLFEQAINPELNKISRQIQHCLKMAGVKADDIQTLFVTGGTSSIPALLSVCKKAVPQARLVEGDKFGSVGVGLALDALKKFG